LFRTGKAIERIKYFVIVRLRARAMVPASGFAKINTPIPGYSGAAADREGTSWDHGGDATARPGTWTDQSGISQRTNLWLLTGHIHMEKRPRGTAFGFASHQSQKASKTLPKMLSPHLK
jgi:hypothetical protein